MLKSTHSRADNNKDREEEGNSSGELLLKRNYGPISESGPYLKMAKMRFEHLRTTTLHKEHCFLRSYGVSLGA